MRLQLIFAALVMLAVPGVSRAVTITTNSFLPPGSTTTWVTNGDSYTITPAGATFMVGRWDNPGAILNQTGGSITFTGDWGPTGIGNVPGGWGIYNMSGSAIFNATNLNGASSAYTFSIQGFSGSALNMTNNAVANIGSLTLAANSGSPAKVVLAGNASLTVKKVGNVDNGYSVGAGSYFDFNIGSLATFTVSGSNQVYYQNLVTNGYIRINGVSQSDFSMFQVSGSTLSLNFRPTGVTAKNSPGGIFVTWVPLSPATGYNVYRSTTNDGSGYLLVGGIAGQSSTNYTDITAKYLTNYYYAVSATNSLGEGAKSVPSSVVMWLQPGLVISIH